MENNKISLNQLSDLRKIFGNNEHFAIYDWDEGYDRLKGMSEKQYKFILAMLANKHYFKIKEVLDHFLKWK